MSKKQLRKIGKKIMIGITVSTICMTMLAGCGSKNSSEKKETEETQLEEVESTETPTEPQSDKEEEINLEYKEISDVLLGEDAKWVKAESEIIESSNPICKNPLENTLFIDREQWVEAVDNTDIEIVKEKKDEFDEEFFEKYSMCYVTNVASGNLEYKFQGVSLEETNGQKVLTVYASYSSEKMLNTQHSYSFFVTLDKEEVEKIDEIKFEEYCR